LRAIQQILRKDNFIPYNDLSRHNNTRRKRLDINNSIEESDTESESNEDSGKSEHEEDKVILIIFMKW